MSNVADIKKESTQQSELHIVRMDDGRDVEFAGKKKMIQTAIIGEDSVQVRIDWVNGESRLFTLHEKLFFRFAAHGAESKLANACAGVDSVEDCILSVDDLIEHLNQGTWSKARQSTGMSGTTTLMRAMIEYTKKSPDETKLYVKGLTFAQKQAMREHPALKPIIARIEAEKTKKDKVERPVIDSDALLAGFQNNLTPPTSTQGAAAA